MRIRIFAAIVATVALGACSTMERYHMPQTQNNVPVKVMVAYGDDHPNHTIKSITEQKMYDDSTRYKFLITDAPNHEATVVYDQDGKRIDGAL